MKRKRGVTAAGTDDAVAVHKRQAVELQQGEAPERPEVVRLPMEMECEVLGWLGVADLPRCALVCRQWNAILSPTRANSDDDDDEEGGLMPPVGRRLWQRAYFNTWPLPPVAAFQLDASMASSEPLPPQPAAVLLKGGTLIDGSDSSDEEKQRPLVESREMIFAQEDVPEERDWRELALTRLRLHHLNVDARFVARSCMDKLQPLASGQANELVDALRTGLRQAELQKRITKMKRKWPTPGSEFVSRARKLLIANTYWTKLRTTDERNNDDDSVRKHKAAIVTYSLVTGLPLHASIQVERNNDAENDDEDSFELYLGSESEDDYGDDDSRRYEEAYFARVMSRASAYLFGQHGVYHQDALEELLFRALDLNDVFMNDLSHEMLLIGGPWSENPFICLPEDLDAQGRLKKKKRA